MPLKQSVRRQRRTSVFQAISYRIPLAVPEVLRLLNGDCYSVCPRCDSLLDREYVRYCDRCGQHLTWARFDHAKVVNWPRKKRDNSMDFEGK